MKKETNVIGTVETRKQCDLYSRNKKTMNSRNLKECDLYSRNKKTM